MTYFRYLLLSLIMGFSLNIKAKNIDSLFHFSNYTESVELLEAESRSNPNSNNYYNLAISYYKLGNKAKAILSIERSFYLDPCNSETREVMSRLYKSTEGPNQYERGFLLTLADNFAYVMSIKAWVCLALLLFSLSMASLIYYFYSYNALHQRIAFYSFIILLVISFISNAAIAHQYYYHRQVEDLAIVKEKTKLYDKANKDGEPLTELSSGNRLELLNNDENTSTSWQRVRLANDKEGYVERSAIIEVIEAIN